MKYVIECVLVVSICFIYAHIDKAHNVYDTKTDNSSYIPVSIISDSYVSQSFKCTENSIDGVSLKLVLSGDSKAGELNYQLLDESGCELLSGIYPIAEIKSGRINKIKFDKKIENTEDNLYTVSIGVTGLEENESLGIYYDSLGERTGNLKVNGENTEGTLILRWLTHRFDVETFIVTLGFVVYFVVFFKILYKLFS